MAVLPDPANPRWLLEHQRSVYSQYGEDGVIEAALSQLPDRTRWCVEFGAWDGIRLSNSRNLIEHAGYSAVLIEANASRFTRLKANYAANPKVHPLRAMVGFTSRDGLDALLAPLPIPADFDLLSIDIDGNDYHVWKAVERLRPRLVLIEINPTVATGVRFVQPPDPAVSQGSGVSSLVELGRAKGYALICVLPHNALFVRDEYFQAFQIADNSVSALRADESYVTHMVVGFDGRAVFLGNQRLLWHSLPLPTNAMQPLPRVLRRFPPSYNIAQTALHLALRFAHDPAETLRAIRSRLRSPR
jgi:hypothetical protein